MTISRVLFSLAIMFAIPGIWLGLQWWRGDFIIFWTVEGAALFQSLGITIVCLYGAWELRE